MKSLKDEERNQDAENAGLNFSERTRDRTLGLVN